MCSDFSIRYNFALICPTYNAGSRWDTWLDAVRSQKIQDFQVLIIDSGSKDQTVAKTKDAGFTVREIPNSEFNHGSTRNLGAEYFGDSVDILVYLTQDAILFDENSLQLILSLFINTELAAVCGRQIPHRDATPIEAHARIFNYSPRSSIKSKEDIPSLGIKTAFMSNSFAAYRRTAFEEVGGFPNDVIFAEDMSLAGRLLLNNWKVGYSAEAKVYHSHDYSLIEEFRRYFDVGVFYKRELWISENFGSASGEGFRFVKSEIQFLLNNRKYSLIPVSIAKNVAKLLAFRLGRIEKIFPSWLKRKLSMNKRYWK